jgi:hypothetical protein
MNTILSLIAENEASLVCSICDLLYCEKCGKLVNEMTHDTATYNKKKKEADLIYLINISSNITRKRCHESALMSATHILVCLTPEGKSIEQIAREDFDNNLELVSVWVDYMIGINWIHSNNGVNSRNPWIATCTGKNWVEKIFSV